jgi:hypothetical protein
MSTLVLDTRDFGFIVGTRAALAAGIALLAGTSLTEERRRIIGTTLLSVGLATTIPAIKTVVCAMRRSQRSTGSQSGVQYDGRLIGATRFARKGDDDRA